MEQERARAVQREREGGELQRGEERTFPPFYSFTVTKLKLLYYLFHNGPTYGAKIARETNLTAARITQLVREFGEMGIVKESKFIVDCILCGATGSRSFGGEIRICSQCNGKGKHIEKTYPVFLEITEEAKPHCLKLFYLMRGIDELKGRDEK